MTDPTNRLPLWKVMRHAYDQRSPQADDQMDDQLGYAAELRAIANWIEKRAAFGPEESISLLMPMVWRIAGMLLDEADRAEAS